MLLQHDRCERHELGAVEALVDGIVYLPSNRGCHDGSVPERSRPVFHPASINGDNLTGDESIHSLVDTTSAVAYNRRIPSGSDRELVVVTPTQVDVLQAMALSLPRPRAITLMQVEQAGTDREPLIAHGRENEHPIGAGQLD